jgi:hypothetical protein
MVANALSIETRHASLEAIFADIRSEKRRWQIEPLHQLFDGVLSRGGTYDDAKKVIAPQKKELPAFIPTGTFSKRRADALLEPSGRLVIDIDNLSYTELQDARTKAQADPCVEFHETSPSGHGLKLIFRVPIYAGPDFVGQHRKSYAAAKARVEKMGFKVDESGGDLARLCFISWDPQAYHNPNAIEIEVSAEEPGPQGGESPRPSDDVLKQYRRIAEEIAPALVSWESPAKGHFVCKNAAEHSHTGRRDTWVEVWHKDHEPRFGCPHDHCRGIYAEETLQLQRELRKIDPSPTGIPPDIYTLWKPSQFLDYVEPPDIHILGPGYLTRGELTALIGQAGIGKSRLSLWLAICQILGRDWCGIPTIGPAKKWLLLGNENTCLRYKTDLQAILHGLTQNERNLIEQNLIIQAVITDNDRMVAFETLGAQLRFERTIKSALPDIIAADPLGNYAGDDISKPAGMTVLVRQILAASRRACPLAAILLLHHGREGRQNIGKAIGWDAGEFGTGGKALFQASRSVWNLARASETDPNQLVLSCAKSNNARPFPPRGVQYDEISHTYSVDPSFDLGSWKDDVAGIRKGQTCSISHVVNAVRHGKKATAEISKYLAEAIPCNARTVQRRIADAEAQGYLSRLALGVFKLTKKADSVPVILADFDDPLVSNEDDKEDDRE